MSEDEKHFLDRMKNEAAQYYDSGHTTVDTDDLRQLVRIASRWPHAQRAINKIDDAFEYRLGDVKSRIFVHEVLAEYTAAIKRKPA